VPIGDIITKEAANRGGLGMRDHQSGFGTLPAAVPTAPLGPATGGSSAVSLLLLIGAPSEPAAKQLRELQIGVNLPSK
jgi:hypothetical protein